jgi:hypothetical protein
MEISRLNRIEENLEKLTDVVGKLAGVVVSLAESQQRLTEGQERLQMAQIETTGKLDALNVFTSSINGSAAGPSLARS